MAFVNLADLEARARDGRVGRDHVVRQVPPEQALDAAERGGVRVGESADRSPSRLAERRRH